MMSKLNSHDIALIGTPNAGKTTLFNRLTRANQRTGNWAGVTVQEVKGYYYDFIAQLKIKVIDLPGCYTLQQSDDMPLDEQISCKFIQGAKHTIFVNVVDVNNLNRDLYLSIQLLEKGLPVIIALNGMDLAKTKGLQVDITKLSKELGCPVVPITAKTGDNLDRLKQQIAITINNPCQAINRIQQREDQLNDLLVAAQRHAILSQIVKDAVTKPDFKNNLDQRIDAIVLHKVFGPLIFVAAMYFMFALAINLGGMLQEYFENFAELAFIQAPQVLFKDFAPAWILNLLINGIGRGICITLTFIPVLSAMFLCLGILESSGYMSRAAFIVDRLMRLLGLPGKAFIPMIVGFGCNVPAVMGARVLDKRRERILTIMMTPFMSCSARLAIYAIFVAAFFPRGGQNVIFSLYLMGIMVAILTCLVLRASGLPTERSLSVMEMPEYRLPSWQSLLQQVWYRVKSFILKAGGLIIVLSLLINGIGTNNLQSLGKYLTPLFAPIGISAENWPATLGLVTGLVAKEAVIGTLNSAYSSTVSLEQNLLQHFGSSAAAYAYLLFTLLYFPCISVVAAIAKELNKKWAAFSVIWSTSLAYIIAALFYQAATWNYWASSNTAWILSLLLVLFALSFSARFMAHQEQKHSSKYKVVPTMANII